MDVVRKNINCRCAALFSFGSIIRFPLSNLRATFKDDRASPRKRPRINIRCVICSIEYIEAKYVHGQSARLESLSRVSARARAHDEEIRKNAMCARVYARVYRYKLFINDRLDDRYFRV